jgi:hypothetical protein
MNPQNSSGAQGTGGNGGWEYSDMRSWLSSTVLPLLPSEVQAGIKEVRKYSDYIVPGESSVTHDQETADKLWIPSAREVRGGTSYEQTGPAYGPISSSTATLVRYSYEINSITLAASATDWWTRSASTNANFRRVGSGGTANSSPAYNTYGVCLGFCI